MKWIQQWWTLVILALIPVASATAQEAVDSNSPKEASFLDLQSEFEVAHSEWETRLEAAADQEKFALWMEQPAGDFYTRFRQHADLGHIPARLWCLEQFSHAEVDPSLAKLMWQGEAFSLATAVRNDAALAQQLRNSLFSGWDYGGVPTVDKVLKYLQGVTEVDEIRRGTMQARIDFMAYDGSMADKAIELSEELLATWPESEEARELARVLEVRRSLVLGGTPPDFVGKDVDGNELNLYGYRGKVLVLDFWGFW